MKKIENINLGGQPFTIDQDAYKALDSYINNISRMLKKSRVKSELIDDIEFRISELISEAKADGPIVTIAHVENVKKVMGDPKVFLSDSDYSSADYQDSKTNSTGQQTKRRKKRLYRDDHDKVLGGVAAGMAAYFGIEESWIMRLIFVLSVFMFGVPLLVYIILWAIIPAAITDEDYAEMRGEAVNLSDITDSVKSEFEDLQKSF